MVRDAEMHGMHYGEQDTVISCLCQSPGVTAGGAAGFHGGTNSRAGG